MRTIGKDGWYLSGRRESHRQFLHPWKPGKVNIAGHPSMELSPKTWKSILRQAGIEEGR